MCTADVVRMRQKMVNFEKQNRERNRGGEKKREDWEEQITVAHKHISNFYLKNNYRKESNASFTKDGTKIISL